MKGTRETMKCGLLLLVLATLAFATDVTSQATVTNQAPSVGSLTITGATGGIDLSAGSTAAVDCNATITDSNGYNDVASANAVIWANTTTEGGEADYTGHYANASCTLSGGSGTTVNARCTFYLQFYANETDWTCKVYAVDNASQSASNNSTVAVNQLVALDLASATLNFGAALAPGTGQGTSNKTETVTNYGNTQIDIRVNGTVMSHASLVASIAVGNLYYDITSNAMESETALSAVATTVSSFNLAKGAASTKDSWWDLHVPAGSAQWVPAGTYSGTITVSAIAG